MSNPTVLPGGGNGWSPMRYNPPPAPYSATRPAVLGEVPPSSTILDSPLLSFATSVTATGASAYVAYGLSQLKSSWATLWWIISAGAGMKALHDLANVQRKGMR
jgi:hypothetical protein